MKNYLDFEGLSHFFNQLLSKFATISDLSKKVDKVDGKGLSTNDFTTEEKLKLESIEFGANKCVQSEVSDDEVVTALIENDLLLAVSDDNGVLTDENGNIIEW